MAKQSEVAPGTIATFDDPKGDVAIEVRWTDYPHYFLHESATGTRRPS
jgi:hypothetical protein